MRKSILLMAALAIVSLTGCQAPPPNEPYVPSDPAVWHYPKFLLKEGEEPPKKLLTRFEFEAVLEEAKRKIRAEQAKRDAYQPTRAEILECSARGEAAYTATWDRLAGKPEAVPVSKVAKAMRKHPKQVRFQARVAVGVIYAQNWNATTLTKPALLLASEYKERVQKMCYEEKFLAAEKAKQG